MRHVTAVIAATEAQRRSELMAVAARYRTTVAKLEEDRALLARQLAALYADEHDPTVQRDNTPSTGFLIDELEKRVKAIEASLKSFGAY
jgi:hypothetical protein